MLVVVKIRIANRIHYQYLYLVVAVGIFRIYYQYFHLVLVVFAIPILFFKINFFCNLLGSLVA